jgi:hypothetical protein
MLIELDTHQPLEARQYQLQERYFFTCNCLKCTGDWDVYATFLNNPCREANKHWILSSYEKLEKEGIDSSSANTHELAQNYGLITSIVSKANAEETPKATHVGLQHAFNLLREVHWGMIIAATPYPIVLRSLIDNYVAAEEIEAALVLLLSSVFHIQPFEFPEAWHPIRVATLRTVATLISKILAGPRYSLRRVRAIPPSLPSEVELFPCVCAVLLLVAHYAPRSHGSPSKLLEGVQHDLADVERYANDTQNNDCLVMLKAGIWDETGRRTAGKYFRQLEMLADISLMSRVIDSVDCTGKGCNDAFRLSLAY